MARRWTVLLCFLGAACAHPGLNSSREGVTWDDCQPCPAPSAPTHAVKLLDYYRGPCFGWCPEYSVRVYQDGVVEYYGLAATRTVGYCVGRMAQERLQAVKALLASSFSGPFYDGPDGDDGAHVTIGYWSPTGLQGSTWMLFAGPVPGKEDVVAQRLDELLGTSGMGNGSHRGAQCGDWLHWGTRRFFRLDEPTEWKPSGKDMSPSIEIPDRAGTKR